MNKKILGLFALSLSFGALAVLPLKDNTPVAVSAEENQFYTEEISESGDTIERTYKMPEDYFSLVSHWTQPNGFTAVVEMDYYQEQALLEQIEDVSGVKSEMRYYGITMYAIIDEAKLYRHGASNWQGGGSTSIVDHVKRSIASREAIITSGQNIVNPVEVGAYIDVDFYDGETTYIFHFKLDTIKINPYKEGDLAYLETFYYLDANTGEKRANLSASLDGDVFNEKYGFLPEKCTIFDGNSYVEYDYWVDRTIYLGSGSSIEISELPNKPLNIQARARVNYNGEDYFFWSSSKRVEALPIQVLIDGNANVKEIEVNTTHKLTFNTSFIENFDENLAGIYAGYYPANDPDNYKELFEIDRDKEGGQGLFYNREFTISQVGTYILDLNFSYYGQSDSFALVTTYTLSVKKANSIPVIDAVDALSFDVGKNVTAITGGGEFNVEAIFDKSIDLGTSKVEYEWSVNRTDVVQLKTDGAKATINPVGAGYVTITVKAKSFMVSNAETTLTINSIANITEVSEVVVPEGFLQTGTDMEISLKVGEYTDIVNLNIEWKVTNSSEEEIEYENLNNGKMIVHEIPNGDYEVAAYFNGIEVAKRSFKVRDTDVDKFIRQNIIWIFIMALVILSAALFIKARVNINKSLITKLEKTYDNVGKIDVYNGSLPSEFKKAKRSILIAEEFARDLNMDTLNQYEKVIVALDEANKYINHTLKDVASLTDEEKVVKVQELDKKIHRALNLAREIEDARAKARALSQKANLSNYQKVEKSKKHNDK